MQMQTSLEILKQATVEVSDLGEVKANSLETLKTRLDCEIRALARDGYSVEGLRQEICGIMKDFPQYYSWSNRNLEDPTKFRIEIFDRNQESKALLLVLVDLKY